MRKSLFCVAMFSVVLAACNVEADLDPAQATGPFGKDLSGSYVLQSINNVLPFTINTTTTFRNEILAAHLLINYDVEKTFRYRICYRQTSLSGATAGTVNIRDSLKVGKWFSTTDAEDKTNFSLQIDVPINAFYVGSTVPPFTVLNHSGIGTTFGVGQTTGQSWILNKQDTVDPLFLNWSCPPAAS